MLLRLGQTVATPGALDALERNSQSFIEFISRHQRGDWGDIDKDDREENEFSVKEGLRILSAYHLKDTTKIYVITEADRSSTCCLLAEEY